jgi:hypothetical protein
MIEYYIDMQYFYLFVMNLGLYFYIAPIYIYIYIYILGLRAIAIKYIKAIYFDFVFLIVNLLLLYAVFIKGLEIALYFLIPNILFSIVFIVKNFLNYKNIFSKELFSNLILIELNFKSKGFQYYCIYLLIFIILYELAYFKNLYSYINFPYTSEVLFPSFIYLHLIPIIIIFLYVMEKNNVINTQYLLFKDRLLLKSWLAVMTFILSFINIVVVFVLSLFLIPVVFYLIYYIHILFGITPDIMELEGP